MYGAYVMHGVEE